MSKKYTLELDRNTVKKVIECKDFEDKIIKDYCKKRKINFQPISVTRYVKDKITKGIE